MANIICIDDLGTLSLKEYILSKLGTKTSINIIEIHKDDNKDERMLKLNIIFPLVLSNIISEYAIRATTLSFRIRRNYYDNNLIYFNFHTAVSDIYTFNNNRIVLALSYRFNTRTYVIRNLAFIDQMQLFDTSAIQQWIESIKN